MYLAKTMLPTLNVYAILYGSAQDEVRDFYVSNEMKVMI